MRRTLSMQDEIYSEDGSQIIVVLHASIDINTGSFNVNMQVNNKELYDLKKEDIKIKYDEFYNNVKNEVNEIGIEM